MPVFVIYFLEPIYIYKDYGERICFGRGSANEACEVRVEGRSIQQARY